MMWAGFLLAVLAVNLVSASPNLEREGLQYQNLHTQAENLPLLKLPYGTWQASKYDKANDIYVFSNIRFARPPIGDLRFRKPVVPPETLPLIQTGDKGGSCIQSISPSMLHNILTKNAGTSFAKALEPLAGGIAGSVDIAKMQGSPAASEDCLFLDVYVPAKAMRGEVKLPVINWIYGGAYITGTKDGVYDGTPLVNSSSGNAIYVGGNYRLGAFGFLGGTTAEKEGAANIGLHDQRAVLQWIQDYIHLVGGDPQQVSLWGESAGGGSVLHQLVAYGGKTKSLFSQAAVMSPAVAPLFDRPGTVEKQFREFADLAGCRGQGFECLRKASLAKLQSAQDTIIRKASAGNFGFGPCADGTLIRQAPPLELISGNFDKSLKSLIVTHVKDEGTMFSEGVPSDEAFSSVIEDAYGNYPEVKNAILAQLPSPSGSAKFVTQKSRMATYMASSTFACHTRYLVDAYQPLIKTYMLQYAHSDGGHGSDLLALFPPTGRLGFTPLSLQFGAADPPSSTFTPTYRTYLTSHARAGDPNVFKMAGSPEWPLVKASPVFGNVLEAGQTTFSLIEDQTNKADDCKVWADAMAAVTNAKGLAPPDGVVKEGSIKIASMVQGPSANFQTT